MRPSVLGATAAVFRNELRLLLGSPSTWVYLAGTVGLIGLFFVIAVGASGEASLRDAVPNQVVALIFCVPLVTMGQLAGERRDGVDQLLFSAPVPLGALVAGKWLAATALCGVLLALTAPIPAALWMIGDPDPGLLLTTYLGLALATAVFTAAGLFASSLTSQPMVAAVTGALILLPTWLAGSVDSSGWFGAIAARISLPDHLRSFAAGVLDLGDLAWFVGFCATFLFLTWRSLEARRWA